ncbi:MAG TPA: AMP-binding protein, partial [Anaeromyxobacteraceae bacterium]|nr:AMP-binding protein [Anaeromyxobacteraceae bacterium]
MSAPSYVSGPSTIPLLGETIGENLRRTVERFPDREALVVVHQGYRATYRQFWDQTSIVARALLVRGVKKGDRIGVWAPNRHEWVVLQYATARMGAILVNINPAYRTHELEYALRHSGVSFLVLARRFRQADYVEMVREVRLRCPDLKQTLVIDDEWGELPDDAKRLGEEELNRQEAALQFDEAINIQYTSGTTGFPKGATLSHHNILNNGFFIGEFLRYTEKDRVCIPVPLYHCFGMVLGNLAITTHGAAMVFPAESFEPQTVMETVQKERCTSLYGVPTMFIAELEHPDFGKYDYSSLRTGIMAGSPCPIETMRRVVSEMHMAEVTICYGMTETSPVSTQTGADDPLDKRVGTVGRVHPHVEIKVINPITGSVVARGETGE